MQSKKKKIISVIVSFALVVTSGLLPETRSKAAEEVVPEIYTGAYGEGVTYSLYKNVMKNPTLILEGTGSTPDFSTEEVKTLAAQYEKQPWIKQYDPNVDVTSSFPSLYNPLDVVINGDMNLGTYTFAHYDGIEALHIGSDVTSIPEGFFDFENMIGCEIFIYGDDLPEIPANAFNSSGMCSYHIYVATQGMADKLNVIKNNLTVLEFYVNVDPLLAYDFTPLRIAYAKGKTEIGLHGSDGVYPEEDLATLKTAVEAAEPIVKLDQYDPTFCSAEEAESKLTALNAALDKLYSNSFSILKAKILEVKKLSEKDYTTGSWTKLQIALAAAEALTENSETATIQASISALTTAMDELISLQELNDMIATLEPPNHYTSASWTASGIADAYAAAINVPADATKDNVAQLTAALTAALETGKDQLVLRTPLDMSKLERDVNGFRYAIEEPEGEGYKTNFTPESWAAFLIAYNEADQIVKAGPFALSEDMTQEQLDNYSTNLIQIWNNMERLPNDEVRAELRKLIEEIEAKKYKESDFTSDGNENNKKIWQTFEMAMRIAKSDVNNETMVISSIQNAIKNLTEAEAALAELKSQLTPPTDLDKDVYLQYTGNWKKQGKNNAMKGGKGEGCSGNFNIGAGGGFWIQIDNLNFSSMAYPTLQVTFNANGDKLQVYSGANWDTKITEGTEASGDYSVLLDKNITCLILSSGGDQLEITGIKIYNDAEKLAEDLKKAKETLAASISAAEKLKEADYTAASWAVLTKALEEARKLGDDATLDQIKAADKTLTDAIKALVKADSGQQNPPASGQQTPAPGQQTPAPGQQTQAPGDGGTYLQNGDVFTAGALKYMVTNATNGALTVAVKAPKSKNAKSLNIPATVKTGNTTYQVTSIAANALKNCKKLKKVTIGSNVTAIGKNAFSNDKALKTVTIKSAKLNTVGKNAFKGIHKKAVIKVPKKQLKKYKKLLKKKGQPKTVKIK